MAFRAGRLELQAAGAVTPPRLVALVVGVTSSEVFVISGETKHVTVTRHAMSAATTARAGSST